MKKCTKCSLIKPLIEYAKEKRSADGRRYSCKECDLERRKVYRESNKEAMNLAARERRKANPETGRQYARNYRDKYPWKTLMAHARKRAAKFGWEYDLDNYQDQIKERVSKMTCEMSGVSLVTGLGAGSQGKRFYNTISIDRIDHSKGYVYSNIRIVCWAMNCAMSTWGEDVLMEVVRSWIGKKG